MGKSEGNKDISGLSMVWAGARHSRVAANLH